VTTTLLLKDVVVTHADLTRAAGDAKMLSIVVGAGITTPTRIPAVGAGITTQLRIPTVTTMPGKMANSKIEGEHIEAVASIRLPAELIEAGVEINMTTTNLGMKGIPNKRANCKAKIGPFWNCSVINISKSVN
jgi:hypothetical protein